MRLAWAFLVLGCSTTHNFQVRVRESSWLRRCVEYRCQVTAECLHESHRRCLLEGLEATCGSDTLIMDGPIKCNY
jgi:hypothetical protein